jgi:hypothetical protein
LEEQADSWHAVRIPDGSSDILLVRQNEVRVLSGTEAAVAIRWAAGMQPELQLRVRDFQALLGRAGMSDFGTSGRPDVNAVLSSVAGALMRGEFPALEIPSTPPITQAELDLLEALRRKRSPPILAPPRRAAPRRAATGPPTRNATSQVPYSCH